MISSQVKTASAGVPSKAYTSLQERQDIINVTKGYEPKVTVVAVTEISEVAEEADAVESPTFSESEIIVENEIENTFKRYQTQWMDDPIISQWRDPAHRIYDVLGNVNELYEHWSSTQSLPFSSHTDRLWLETGHVMAEIGLPWYNSQANLPTEIDTSFPYHFKHLEQRVIREKGARVGDPNASGYVANPSEANCYCIRAIQQELREKCPTARPLFVYDNFDINMVISAEKFFGLQTYRVNLKDSLENVQRDLVIATSGGERPVIFAATLATAYGSFDDLDVISTISKTIPLILHVDASRNFDYITTLSKQERQSLGIKELVLANKPLVQPLQNSEGVIVASSIVAGGANHTKSAPVVALKPAALGGKQTRVAYIRAFDSTLAGSRDAMAPLWSALQEIRFGASGFQQIYRQCVRMRALLIQALASVGVTARPVPNSLALIVESCSQEQICRLKLLGGTPGSNGDVAITIQPSVKSEDLRGVVFAVSRTKTVQLPKEVSAYEAFSKFYRVPQCVVDELMATVHSWKIASRSAAGYPFHMGSYSALGPVIGHFLDVDIPQDWAKARGDEILKSRMKTFGLCSPEVMSQFHGAFTNGSTMGNRVGIHAALTRLPGAYLYFSTESHFSVMKTARDCDVLTNRWSTRKPRYSPIKCDKNGSILVDALVKQALADWRDCIKNREEYHLILFANMGTTFLGARDNLKEIYAKLRTVGIEISHIHVDGALDFGFGNCGVTLGLPGTVDSVGIPSIQGITLSHHKALGGMVSGEVIYWDPEGDRCSPLAWNVEQRVVFETWLYAQAYSPTDIARMFKYCRTNALRLESGLKQAGLVVKLNPESITVVLDRPPSWVIEEFSLRPEGDWVHFITMPHVSPETIDLFVNRVKWIDQQCLTAFSYITPLMRAIMMRRINLQRLHSQDPLAKEVTELSSTASPINLGESRTPASIIKTSVRSALSVMVLDEHNRVEGVLLIESLRDASMRVGPLLLRTRHIENSDGVIEIMRQLAGFMARHMAIRLQVDGSSYALYEI
ncbi:hypothetical protein TWF696_000487 [Orbilia brochopaga]|uniref:Histidine decarboxylase n=1 Tax=Orbilia brochopaga TaxID=3140254 RepID=A0AAV9VBF6_9PEZI